MATYGRIYKNEAEKIRRLEIFRDNVEFIESFNAAGTRSYKLGINQFADTTNKEFRSLSNGYKRLLGMRRTWRETPFIYENVTVVLSEMDWRKKGAVTPIRDSRLVPLRFQAYLTSDMPSNICDGNRLLLGFLSSCGHGEHHPADHWEVDLPF
ncbi:hypothetical protein CRG98_045811 [Punica granatum]|uniref:Cathepsin propeptide inhibitor domain-containing protein n=1 Tax=Punica granatum TaxID=22663 RepID=A0A2I0HQ28_PUNGR|nr:hypothetical protein CRG98_045811 [Punica granatum]